MNLFSLPQASAWKRLQQQPALATFIARLVETLCWPARFADPEVERQFTIEYGRGFADFRRAAIILGTLVWMCFGWWEISLARHSEAFRPYFAEIFFFRVAGTLAATAAIVLSFRPTFVRDETAHRVMLSGMAIMFVCLTVQTFLAPRPFNYTHFFVGFYLILFYQFGFLRLRAKATLLLTLGATGAILLAQLLSQGIDPDLFWAGMFYIANVVVIGHSVNVNAERHVRDRYLAVQALARSNDALQGANAELGRKHQDLEQARREQQTRSDALMALREQQKEAAEQASRAKSRFLAAAAHDLRQPMHALNMFLAAADEALAKRDIETSTALIGDARKASALSARLFNAVLDLSKLESGHVKPSYSGVDLDRVAQDVVEQLAPFAASLDVKLRYSRGGRHCAMVRTDADWIPRVLSNLVSNGIKYADRAKAGRCAVIVAIVRMQNYVRVDVVDNGIGIASKHWDAIFQPFVQISNPERDREKGLGLGLSIVNAAVSLMEGHRMEFKSIEGKGSRFSIRLPVAQAGAEVAVPITDVAPSRASLRGLYILLVEDDRLVRASTEALFGQWGVLFDSANSLAELETLAHTIERLPDLVITDYRLPERHTAHDVVHLIAAQLPRPVPCLVITGEAGINAEGVLPERCILSKPLSADTLAARMVELASRQRSVV
ncbi:signal transduction histidine kinase [Paraburkholderia atlantica]|uniref:ATP-binding response regulator n=1 Tax=Paraburkholderia atlantica TaxID=2654982 RepID=UPI003D227E0A